MKSLGLNFIFTFVFYITATTFLYLLLIVTYYKRPCFQDKILQNYASNSINSTNSALCFSWRKTYTCSPRDYTKSYIWEWFLKVEAKKRFPSLDSLGHVQHRSRIQYRRRRLRSIKQMREKKEVEIFDCQNDMEFVC